MGAFTLTRCVLLSCMALLASSNPSLYKQFSKHRWAKSSNEHNFGYGHPSVSATSLQAAEDHLVTDLPGLPTDYTVEMHAGLVSVYEDSVQNNGSLFYWLFDSLNEPSTDPLIIWLNGGPGCSSIFDGLFAELGPLRVQEDDITLSINEHAWNQQANLLFVDQPVGTGLSTVSDADDMEAYAQNQGEVDVMFEQFLLNFLDMFPQLKGRKIYFAGESYAGIYIPSITRHILQSDRSADINLAGLMIGNGWSDPKFQTITMPEMALNIGIIGSGQFDTLKDKSYACGLELEKYRDTVGDPDYYPDTCDEMLDDIFMISGSNQTTQMNAYDYRLYDLTGGEDWPPMAIHTRPYLNNPAVREAIHVGTEGEVTECSDPVYYALMSDAYLIFTIDYFPDILTQLPILVFNGQFDFICNHRGTTEYLDRLEWDHKKAYAESTHYQWVVDEATAGYARAAANLTYLVVLGGSHMVPMDVPVQSLDMLHRFMDGQPFDDINYPITPADVKRPEEFYGDRGLPTGIVVLSCFASFGAGVMAMYCFYCLTKVKGSSRGYATMGMDGEVNLEGDY